jgi:hypothetical protein
MKMAKPFSFKPPMTAVRSSINHEKHEVIIIRKIGVEALIKKGFEES